MTRSAGRLEEHTPHHTFSSKDNLLHVTLQLVVLN